MTVEQDLEALGAERRAMGERLVLCKVLAFQFLEAFGGESWVPQDHEDLREFSDRLAIELREAAFDRFLDWKAKELEKHIEESQS
jgi:hypothetical protein